MATEVRTRRLRVLEIQNGAPPVVRVTVRLVIGKLVEVGREAEIEAGPEDPLMSRVALTVTPLPYGWEVSVTNRNGGLIHPWGQPPLPALQRGRRRLAWPLLGVRLTTEDGRPQHWVLLEAADLRVTRVQRPLADAAAGATEYGEEVPDLTPNQLSALRLTFEPHLRWPPATRQLLPRQLKQVATALGISDSAVQQRLERARDRALRLGLAQEVGLLDPAYLYVLVGAGHIPSPSVGPW